MAISKVSITSILLCLLLVNLAEAADQTESTKAAASPTSGKIDCDAACAARCQLASRQRLCHRACGTCCAVQLCPSGYFRQP
ncbi:snakin-2-like [Eucalyptus grandis]|uniref:snakin-2-like n=1 Tax=Eucalyptus grandis TaxID=71139 RepID=UPI00192F003E|nr:snakin-2-like [Eucalyptus grandis]